MVRAKELRARNAFRIGANDDASTAVDDSYERVLDFGREQLTKTEFAEVVRLFGLLHELHRRTM